MKKTLSALTLFAIAATSILWWQSRPETERHMVIGGVPHRLLIADEPRERQRGLGGRDALGTDTVMLFVFPEDGRHGIWMKDMRFAIDILWLDHSRRVVHIEKGVLPETYPTVYYPEQDARYVIEMSAGSVDRLQLNRGHQLEAWPSG